MKNVAAITAKMRDSCPAMRVRAAGRMLAKLYDEALRGIGLEMSQLPVLVAVASQGDRGFKMTELARVLVLDRTSVTRAVRPLETAGMLRVARSLGDARLKIVIITRAGEHMLRLAYPRWERTTRRVRERFGAARMAALNAELSALVAAGPELARTSKRASSRRRS
jgi:DNA-binding MarR family transcriptional regulator